MESLGCRRGHLPVMVRMKDRAAWVRMTKSESVCDEKNHGNSFFHLSPYFRRLTESKIEIAYPTTTNFKPLYFLMRLSLSLNVDITSSAVAIPKFGLLNVRPAIRSRSRTHLRKSATFGSFSQLSSKITRPSDQRDPNQCKRGLSRCSGWRLKGMTGCKHGI